MSEKEKLWDGLGKVLNDMGGNYGNSVRDGINQRLADEANFSKKYPGAVRGGTDMVDFNARVSFNDSGHLTINAPSGDVGGNPKDVLFRLIMKKDGDEITAKVGNNLLESRGDILSSKSIGFSGQGAVLGINTGANLTPSVKSELMDNIQLNFDIKFTQQVINWTRDNPNGAAIKVGDQVVAYDARMVSDLRKSAEARYDHLVGSALRRSSLDGDTPAQSVAQANGNDRASVAPQTPRAEEFRNNPMVQQVSAALERNGVPSENQNPSLVAGLAGAAASNGLPRVQDVVFSSDQRTAFLTDRDKSDPAARIAPVDTAAFANKSFDEVWQKASVSLQQAQTPAVVAQAQGQDLEQKQSARAM